VKVVCCDPGVDDAVALATLAGLGVTPDRVVAHGGNVPGRTAARVAAGMCALLGWDLTVELGPEPDRDVGERYHGADGFGGVCEELLPDAPVTTFVPGSLDGADVLAVGPLTPLAGETPSRITWMGGGVAGVGNMTAVAEFNAWADPEAADAVLTSGVPIRVVPLDATWQVRLRTGDLARFRDGPAHARALARACETFEGREDEPCPHDAVAAVAWLEPDLFTWEPRHVRCELDGSHTRGMTVFDRRPFGSPGEHVEVCTTLDAAAVHDRIVEAVLRDVARAERGSDSRRPGPA
jgi:purine nucleosidase